MKSDCLIPLSSSRRRIVEHLLLHRFQGAVLEFQHRVEDPPPSMLLFVRLGLVHERIGNSENLFKDSLRCTRVDPRQFPHVDDCHTCCYRGLERTDPLLVLRSLGFPLLILACPVYCVEIGTNSIHDSKRHFLEGFSEPIVLEDSQRAELISAQPSFKIRERLAPIWLTRTLHRCWLGASAILDHLSRSLNH